MKISASAGKRNKIHISVDGDYKFTVDGEYWYSSPYSKMTEITESEEEEKFLFDIGSRSAFISGLNILSYGDNSRRTLFQKLTAKGHKKEYVSAALDKLEEYGYVSDRRFAENFAQRLISSKHMSKAGIRRELAAKGVDRALADEVVEALELNPADEIDALLAGKFRRNLADEKGIKRTVAALQRLGYGWSDIKSALDRNEIYREDD
ncbi:MAG: regulatory protein RecX [Clostridia bacterium]|nr:regulatory protein RecX [Clostridia bacterium]